MKLSGDKKELLYLLILILPFLLFSAYTVSQFQQPPSPLYGGDYWWHYGESLNIHNGNAPWANPQIPGEYNHYGWLYHSMVAYTAKLTGLDIMKTFLSFPTLILVLSALTMFFLGKRLFKKTQWSLLFVFVWMTIFSYTTFIEIHPRPFAITVLTPLFFLAFLNLAEEKTTKNKVYLGLTIGALGLAHFMSLVSAALFVVIYFLYEIISSAVKDAKTKKKKKTWKTTKELADRYWLSGVIGFLVSLPYTGPLLFVYKFHALNDVATYSSPIPGPGGLIGFFRVFFFDTQSMIHIVLSLLSLLAFVYIVKNRKIIHNKLTLVMFLSTFVGVLYYIITLPLGIDLLIYWQMMLYNEPLLKTILITSGVIILFNSVKKVEAKYFILGAVVLLLAFQGVTARQASLDHQWNKVGMQPMQGNAEVADWVKTNTDKNAVFISTNELSGAINYMTGRKLVVNRGTHSSQFVDLDKRQTDVAIILYGNDDNKRRELIKKYNIEYVYFDNTWVNSLTWDPFLVKPENAVTLDRYNISYDRVHTKLDPAKNNVPTYDMLVIKYNGLWAPGFENKLFAQRVWTDQQGQPVYAILQINQSAI